MAFNQTDMCPISREWDTCRTLLNWGIGRFWEGVVWLNFWYGFNQKIHNFIYLQNGYFSCIWCFHDVIAISIKSAVAMKKQRDTFALDFSELLFPQVSDFFLLKRHNFLSFWNLGSKMCMQYFQGRC